MSTNEIKRKISVIFATDVVDYSKHMESDENETIKNLRSCEEILTKLFQNYDGRLFNSGGDSFFAEFPSAVNAIECSVEFQKTIKKRNSSGETTVPLEFRVGINMGDVIEEKENLLGDGVNIAARLESLAQPNGITISKSIYDLVKTKIKYEFNNLGEQRVKKNIFHAYDILLDKSHKRKLNKKSSSLSLIIIISAIVFAGLIGAFYFNFINTTFNKESPSKDLEYQATSLPFILVEPFKTLNASSDDNTLGTGITESMISILSQYTGISVLSSNTSFHVDENSFTDTEIKNQYNVDYIVRGSIQTYGTISRITVSLTDLSQNKVLWSEQKDFDMQDIFKVQDEMGNKILNNLQITAVTGSQGTSWANDFNDLETFTTYLNWRNEWRKYTPEGYKKAESFFENIKKKMPDSPVVLNILGWQIAMKIWVGLSDDIENDKENLRMTINKLIDLRGRNEDFALKSAMELYLLSQNCEIVINDIEKALSLGGNVEVYTVAGSVFSGCGNLERGMEYTKKALALTPNDNNWFLTNILVGQYYKLGKYDEIRNLVGEKINAPDMSPLILAVFSVSEFESGNKKKATELFERFKSTGKSKDDIMSWFPETSYAESLIDGLKLIGDYDLIN